MQFASRIDGFIVSSRAAKIEENNIYSASASGYATVFLVNHLLLNLLLEIGKHRERRWAREKVQSSPSYSNVVPS
jgi:hypothetical protein